ncbi:MAG: hypothetical protein M3R27_04795 [Bacteroidota bacterium]|nr:hypothetical protein [Bacteroidota bacterium]
MGRKKNWPRIINWLLIGVVICTNFNNRFWDQKEKIIAWDVVSYYGYLPSAFIYNDLKLDFIFPAPPGVDIWFRSTPEGGRVFQFTCGLAIMYSPFFFASHAYASSCDVPNGYSAPYKFGLIASSIFYLGFALLFIRKTLQRYFPDKILSLTCIVLVLGTNLFYYSTVEPAMSHTYSFFLIAAFVYYSIRWHENPSVRLCVLLGLLAGLISLTRPSNIIIVLFFVLWGVRTFEDFKKRASFLIYHYRQISLMIALCILVWVPQFVYWKYVTGHFLYYSYGSEEKFFFNDPKILDGLFSYRKGWLLYTPVMGFALLGIFLLKNKLRSFFLPILVFLPVNFYIIFSWWCWWYGGCFGMRPMIDCYPLLAVPLAAFFYYASQKKLVVKISLITILFGLILLNQFQMLQVQRASIHWDAMSKDLYWKGFGKLDPIPEYYQLLDTINYKNAQKGFR